MKRIITQGGKTMAERVVEAADTFCRFLAPKGANWVFNTTISKGTKGVVEDGKVTFDLGNGETGSAPLADDSNLFSSRHIQASLLKDL